MIKRIKWWIKDTDGYWLDMISDVIHFLLCKRKGCKWAKDDFPLYTTAGNQLKYTCKRCGCHTTSDNP